MSRKLEEWTTIGTESAGCGELGTSTPISSASNTLTNACSMLRIQEQDLGPIHGTSRAPVQTLHILLCVEPDKNCCPSPINSPASRVLCLFRRPSLDITANIIMSAAPLASPFVNGDGSSDVARRRSTQENLVDEMALVLDSHIVLRVSSSGWSL
jgi:hypothetical protein